MFVSIFCITCINALIFTPPVSGLSYIVFNKAMFCSVLFQQLNIATRRYLIPDMQNCGWQDNSSLFIIDKHDKIGTQLCISAFTNYTQFIALPFDA